MKPVEFIEKVEGNDSKPLGNGLFGATWDVYGKCWNIGPGLTHGITKSTVWTQAQIDAAVASELSATEKAVDTTVKVPLGENQRTVLVSFAYNIGTGGFEKSSVLTVLNAGHYDQVPAHLALYNKAKGVLVKGLVNRRNQEIALWKHPDEHPPLPVQSVSVPKADPHPNNGVTLMATVTPIAMPVTATATAGVNVSSSTIISGLLNSFLGMIVTFGGPILTLLQGSTTSHYLAAAGTAVVGLGTTVASVANMLKTNAVASSNTLTTISNLTNLAQQALPALQAAAAPAPVAASPSPAPAQ